MHTAFRFLEFTNHLCAIAIGIAALWGVVAMLTRGSRASYATFLVISSFLFGTNLWIWSALNLYQEWGLTALIIGILMGGIGVIPLAFIALALHGQWADVGLDVALLVIFLLFRFGGLHLGAKVEGRAPPNGDRS
jgi:hypothetical protein